MSSKTKLVRYFVGMICWFVSLAGCSLACLHASYVVLSYFSKAPMNLFTIPMKFVVAALAVNCATLLAAQVGKPIEIFPSEEGKYRWVPFTFAFGFLMTLAFLAWMTNGNGFREIEAGRYALTWKGKTVKLISVVLYEKLCNLNIIMLWMLLGLAYSLELLWAQGFCEATQKKGE